MSKKVLILLTASLVPALASASVQITEIMYDVSGSDAGREWVEFTNTGASSLDATGFKFFENNTNHALTLLQGSGVLLPGASALIVEDQEKFLADNPSFGGTLFRASFSLGNTGEAVGLKDSALDFLDSISYDSSAGASGDGKSLARSGASFTSAAPTPGSFAGSTVISDDSGVSAPPSSPPQPPAQAPAGGGPPLITASIEANGESMVGGGGFFYCEVVSETGATLAYPRCIWNFGDGSTAEGVRVFHAYDYPGDYEVVLEAAYNYSSATARKTVSARAAAVSLLAEGDGSLTIGNLSGSELDVGLWSVIQSEHRFVIPEHTIVLANHGVRFAPHVLGFAGDTRAVLLYPNSALAAKAAVGKSSPLRGASVALPAAVSAKSSNASAQTSAAQTAQIPNVPASDLGASVAESGAWGVQWTYLLALVAVIATGAVGAYYARMSQKQMSETDALAEEFEIE